MRKTPGDVREGTVLCLTIDYQWDRAPKHALDIPPMWARALDGDFSLTPSDVLTRDQALRRMASENGKALKAEGGPKEWTLALEVGEIDTSSFVNLNGGADANFNLNASLSLVKPTEAEIQEHAGKGGEA